MASQGWIKLYRQIQECEIWIDDTDEPFDRRSAWIDLLLLVNHRDKQIIFDGKVMTVGRGQYVTSVRKLGVRWSWGNQKTLKYLRLLEELGMIKKESDSRRTLITIVNYEVYQDTENDNGTVSEQYQNSIRTVAERKSTTNKNIKNDKNDKNEKNILRSVYFPDDEALNEEFSQYVQMRKANRKPFKTDHAIELSIKKLNELSGGDNRIAILILQQSIRSGWQGLFELKEMPKAKQMLSSRYESNSDLEESLLSN